MRKDVPAELERGRYGPLPDQPTFNGMFMIKGPWRSRLLIVASEAAQSYGWDHVSVSCKDRCPSWVEMCFVKNLFWDEDEAVIQLHVPKDQYVNNHPYVLHLWKPPYPLELPPSFLVGVKGMGEIKNAEQALEALKQGEREEKLFVK